MEPGARRIVDRYLARADRAMPGRLVGAYVVGSTALGSYRPGRSDVDLVAVLDRRVPVGRLRALHELSFAGAAGRALARGQLGIPGNVNAVYVRADDLTRPVTTIVPVASHTGL